MEALKRVLLADDDPTTRRLVSAKLEQWGYEVVQASDGHAAWEVLRGEDSPPIVILDWIMPGMSGVDVCRSLRAQKGRPYRYVLFLSSKSQKQDQTEAFEAGADDFLAKPVHARELEEKLSVASKTVEKRRRTQRNAGASAARHSEPQEEVPPPRASLEGSSPSSEVLPGSVIGGKYKIVRLIASGGMGKVWEGVHTTLGTRVAIKFILAEFVGDADSMARFETEARATARLRSRYAVHVYDYGVAAGGMPYLVMEYLEGRSLTDVIEASGALPPPEVASVISQAAVALDKAYKIGIIHRDIKPDNIMLIPDEDASEDEGRRWQVKVLDFGLAKVFLEHAAEPSPGAEAPTGMRQMTARGAILGTPMFMSPDQLMGSPADRYSDLWGLAMCAFVAMTGRLPFTAKTLGELIKQVCLNPLPVPSSLSANVPPRFDEWFARACAPSRETRFQSGTELARELHVACGLPHSAFYTMSMTPLPMMLDAPPLVPSARRFTPESVLSPPVQPAPPAEPARAESPTPPTPPVEAPPQAPPALQDKAPEAAASALPRVIEVPTGSPSPASVEGSTALVASGASARPASMRPTSRRPPSQSQSSLVVSVAVGLLLIVAFAALVLRA